MPFGGAFTIGKAQRARFIANVNGPHVRHRVQPRGLFDIKSEVEQFLLEASDGIFQGGIFAGNKRLGHGDHFCRTESAQ